MRERSGEGWHGILGGQAPVQGWGRVDGLPWYFRARGDTWSFEIAEDPGLDEENLPDVGDAVAGWAAWERWGKWPDASAMAADTAWSIVEACIARFRSRRLPYLVPGGPNLPPP
ncbi:MAG: hypothetical protein ACTHOH_06885 [Lysobacteraceae bacterium]